MTLVTKVKKESSKYGLEINKKKTQTMVITKEEEVPKVNIKIDGKSLEQVHKFTYLGQQITEDGRSEEEIKRRIAISKPTRTIVHAQNKTHKMLCLDSFTICM